MFYAGGIPKFVCFCKCPAVAKTSRRLLRVCSVTMFVNVLFNCVKELISCSCLPMSAALLKSLERWPH